MIDLERFIIPPWFRWLMVATLVASVVGAIYAYGRQQYGLGMDTANAAWLKRENTQTAARIEKLKELEGKYRALEHDHALRLAAVSAQYQEDLKNAQARKDRVIADLRTGNQRLRIPVATTGCAGAGGVPEAGTGAGGRDGGATAELSDAAAEFLVGLAGEADEVAEQLKACQALVREDRGW